MFGMGMPEILLILAIALIVIGPKKLPELAKSMGRAIGEFRNATSDLKESMTIDTELKDVKKAFDDMNDNIKGTIDVTPEPENKSSDVPPDDKQPDDKGKGAEMPLVMKDDIGEPLENTAESEKKSPIVSVSPYDEKYSEEKKQKPEGTLNNGE